MSTSNLKQKIGVLAAQAIKLAISSGLSWDEAVAAFGVASKALANDASKHDDGNLDECIAHAQKRFNQGLEQKVDIQVASVH